MAISDRDREMLEKRFNNENLAHAYQQFLNYIIDGAKTGILDKTEYKIYVEMTLKRDVAALAHAFLSGIFNFEEYWDRLQAIVGYDLMIQGVFDGQIKAKSNGEDTDKEVDVNDDLMELNKDE